jgi:2-polyprenyl-3-methyl-5-hydroxy-6-metoxy-1,4-benzoquinol methylase
VYFDGINKFYVSGEHSELDIQFLTPPNVFDENFLTEDSFFVPISNRQHTSTENEPTKHILKATKADMMDLNISQKISSTFRKLLKGSKQDDGGHNDPTPKIIYSASGELPTLENPVSQLCTTNQMQSPIYTKWIAEMGMQARMHRKQWEWVYILEVLSQSGMLNTGKRGLGFGCGLEPMSPVITNFGAEVTITDMADEEATEIGWVATGQHLKNVQSILDAHKSIVKSQDDFFARCSYQTVDMNHIPETLVDFDFTWSSCAFEHLGSIRHGLDFVFNSLGCLKPGGVAIHTTEFNLTSNDDTFESPTTSVFRLKDFEELKARVESGGHRMAAINTTVGSQFPDTYVDLPPYKQETHLRLALGDYASTSVGVILWRGE